MTKRRLLFFVLLANLLLVTLTVLAMPGDDGLGDSYFPDLGNGGYDVQHYAITLDADMAANTINAQTRLTLTATQPLSQLNLEFAQFDISAVSLDDAAAEFAYEQGELVVTLPRTLEEGETADLIVSYSGTPGRNWIDYGDGVMVFGEPRSASSWYPVNEHPLDKATYTVDVTVDEAYTVAAPGIGELLDAPPGKDRLFFAPRDPMASYLMTLAIGEFTLQTDVSPDGVPIRNYFAATLDAALIAEFAQTPEMIDVFADYFGPYPFEVYGVVVHDVTMGAALETQTLSTFGTTLANERVAAHELAHQWFGNSVSLGDWRDIWLNEGFASYGEILWIEHDEGRAAADRAIARWYTNMAAASPPIRFNRGGLVRALNDLPLEGRSFDRATITQAFGALLGDVLSAEELAALVPSDLETISGEDLPGLLTLAPSESIMLRPGALLDFLEIVGLTDMLDARSLPVVPGDPGPQRIFNRVVYERGALTLHALRLEVGDDAFFETLRSYAATYANGNARTPDFIAIAEQVSGQDLTDFFNAWLYQPSVPDIPQMGLFWAEAVR